MNKEKSKRIAEQYKAGVPVGDIAKDNGINVGQIYGVLDLYNIPRRIGNEYEKYRAYLEENYQIKPIDEMCNELQIGKQKLFSIASKFGLHRKNTSYACYSDEEDSFIRKYYEEYGVKYVQENFLPYRTIGSVRSRAGEIGVKTKERWTKEEENILTQYYRTTPIDEFKYLLPNRTRNAIISHANLMGYVGIVNKNFTAEDDEFIRNNYLIMSDDELANALSRDRWTLKNHRNHLGLHRESNPYFDSISEFVRKNNYEWKIKSMKYCDYKCVITGERFNDIHHLYGVNLILQQVELDTGIEFTKDINSMTDKEKSAILTCFLKEQGKHPLGVCLTSKVHKDFHRKYGYGNNRPQQFYEFKNNYRN